MFGYISTSLIAIFVIWTAKELLSLRRNVAIVKVCGLPYTISPINAIAGYVWHATHGLVLTVFLAIPGSDKWLLPMILEPYRGWNFAEELREVFGEAFAVVSPGQIYMNFSNAEAIRQIAARRNDFLKPIEFYGIVDIFGVSMLSSEGENWKRQHKIASPAFSEKSNALVWKESLNQATGLLKFWSALDGNCSALMKVKDTAPETSLLTLHVISGAGFGVRQLWDPSEETKLGAKAIAGFNTGKLKGTHTVTFKYSLNALLKGILWIAIFPMWLLMLSPFEIHKKLMRSYLECAEYFKELIEYRVDQLERGVEAEEGTMDLMGPLIKASESNPDDTKGLYMTKQEAIANSWIFLFAGHETTGNTLHFALLFLAIELATQAHLQADIDIIVGSSSPEDWTYETDMGRLYQSMVGATLNETLRLMPPILDIPKIAKGTPKSFTMDGKTITVPPNTYLHINATGVHRNPRYWPHSPSKITSKTHDLDDFIPQRWLPTSKPSSAPQTPKATPATATPIDGLENASFESHNGLFTPIKGAFVPFSDGPRACPGRRFAQVEITAVLAVIFRAYTVELDVGEWASDEAVSRMGEEERRALYEIAKGKARKLIRESEPIITLQMQGTYVPVRFVERGSERFRECYVA